MTREVLEKKLKIAGIPDYIYNLTGQGKNDECLCLEKIQDKWSVYYLERGIKTTNEISSRHSVRRRHRKQRQKP